MAECADVGVLDDGCGLRLCATCGSAGPAAATAGAAGDHSARSGSGRLRATDALERVGACEPALVVGFAAPSVVAAWVVWALILWPVAQVRADTPVLPERAIAQLVAAARETADDGERRERRTLSRRARLSGLVPRLRLGLRRGQQFDLYRDAGFDVGAARTSQDEELSLEATAIFQLDRLVFAPEQIRLQRASERARKDEQAQVREVIGLWVRFEQCWLERASAAAPDPVLELEIAQLRVVLDLLTGGVFSRLWGEHAPKTEARPPSEAETNPLSRQRPQENDAAAIRPD